MDDLKDFSSTSPLVAETLYTLPLKRWLEPLTHGMVA